MATTSQVTSARIEINLRAVWAEIDGMPETANDWATYDDENQFEYALEWPDLLARFRSLVHASETGQMTTEQHDRYERLVHRYEEVLPLIKQLDLSTIPVPKLTTRHR